MLKLLTSEDLLTIHKRVCADFSTGGDPVFPAGVRSMDLLESAVARQQVGMQHTLKYATATSCAATLTFGVCNNHPFHNGNKRTALVAMLAHLDANNMCLYDVRQNELYKMIKGVASHTLGERPQRRGAPKPPKRRPADDEVSAIQQWLDEYAKKVDRSERRVTYRQLRTLLKPYGYYLDNPKNNSIGVYRDEPTRKGLLRKQTTVPKRIGTISYPGDTKIVGLSKMRQVRRMCRLTDEDGVHAAAFYEEADVLDVFINEYRAVLNRLSNE
jgi:death-on-curing protein